MVHCTLFKLSSSIDLVVGLVRFAFNSNPITHKAYKFNLSEEELDNEVNSKVKMDKYILKKGFN